MMKHTQENGDELPGWGEGYVIIIVKSFIALWKSWLCFVPKNENLTTE